MSHYCHQVSYTTDARRRLLHDPEDQFAAIRTPIEKLGGTLQSCFFTLGPYDVLAISEFPAEVSAADIAVAFSQGGAIALIHTIPLMPLTEARESHSDSADGFPIHRNTSAFAAASGR